MRGVVLEETIPEELQVMANFVNLSLREFKIWYEFMFLFPCSGQKQATVRSSVLEVLLEITNFCDLYLMECVLVDESEVSAKPFCLFPFY